MKVIYFILNIIKIVIMTITVLFLPIMVVIESISTGDYRGIYFISSIVGMAIIIGGAIEFYDFVESNQK